MQMQQQSVVLNSSKLRTISHASHTAEVTMTALSQRDRLRSFTDIVRMKNSLIRSGEKIVDADYVSFWTALQEAGVGVIVYGRKGKPDRWEWHYSMKKVAEAALEGKDIKADRVGQLEAVAAPAPAPSKKVEIKSGKIVHMSKSTDKPVARSARPNSVKSSRFIYIPLRKDFNLEFTVPADISKEEIETINRALGRLSA